MSREPADSFDTGRDVSDNRQKAMGRLRGMGSHPRGPSKRPSPPAHGTPLRAAESWRESDDGSDIVDQDVHFTAEESDADAIPQRGKHGGKETDVSDIEWDSQEYAHRVNDSDVTMGETVYDDLPKRKFRLNKGCDVAVPTANGDWFETADGEKPERPAAQLTRSKVEAVLQRYDIGRRRQRNVLAALEREESFNHWSSFGGSIAAAAAVLMHLGDTRGEIIVKEELDSRLRWWSDVKGIKRRQRVLVSFCFRIAEFAEERGLV